MEDIFDKVDEAEPENAFVPDAAQVLQKRIDAVHDIGETVVEVCVEVPAVREVTKPIVGIDGLPAKDQEASPTELVAESVEAGIDDGSNNIEQPTAQLAPVLQPEQLPCVMDVAHAPVDDITDKAQEVGGDMQYAAGTIDAPAVSEIVNNVDQVASEEVPAVS